jgi:hypothetical protein
MEVPSVTEVPRQARGATAIRVGWRLAGDDVEPLSADAMLLQEADPVAAATARAALVLWLRDPGDADRWGARGSDEIGGFATALDLAGADGAQQAFAVGPVHPFTGSAGRAARLWIGEELRASGDLLHDYAESVRAAQRLLEARGAALRPGELMLVGACEPVPVASGDFVRAEIDGLERLAVTIAD